MTDVVGVSGPGLGFATVAVTVPKLNVQYAALGTIFFCWF